MKLNMEKAIQNLVDESGLSQYQLEKNAGLGSGALTKAKGHGDIRLTTLNRIADGLGWNITQVIDAMDIEDIKSN